MRYEVVNEEAMGGPQVHLIELNKVCYVAPNTGVRVPLIPF